MRRIVLLAHDKPEKRERYKKLLLESDEGYEVDTASCGEEAVEKVASLDYCVIVLDVLMPNTRRDEKEGRFDQEGGIFALERIQATKPHIPVIMFSQRELSPDIMDKARIHRIYDYLVRDEEHFEFKFLNRIRHAEEVYRNRASLLEEKSEIVYRSGAMKQVILRVREVAASDTPVLVLGETGTGKGLVAKEIHKASARSRKPFLQVNCAAIPDTLVESEVFGHTEGAFTGAVSNKKGLMERADGGTLFLDEIGDMSLPAQSKLLRAIEEKEFQPVGSEQVKRVDVRIICASNKDLERLMNEGRFREDLYYRICHEKIEIPPLSTRREDIEPLVAHFVEQYCHRRERRIGISPRLMERLKNYPLRGNVRELRSIVETALLRMHPGEEELTENHLEARLFAKSRSCSDGILPEREDVEMSLDTGGLELDRALDEFKWTIIDAAMERSGGVAERAAKMLNVNPHTLRRYLRERHKPD